MPLGESEQWKQEVLRGREAVARREAESLGTRAVEEFVEVQPVEPAHDAITENLPGNGYRSHHLLEDGSIV